MGKSVPTGPCERAAPIANALALVVNRKASSKFGYIRIGQELFLFFEGILRSELKLNLTSFWNNFVKCLDIFA